MKQKCIYSAYRTPRFSWKDIGKSLLTLGLKKPADIEEKSKLYKLIAENDSLEIYEELSTVSLELVESVKLKQKELSVIKEKNKYYIERYVYHLEHV